MAAPLLLDTTAGAGDTGKAGGDKINAFASRTINAELYAFTYGDNPANAAGNTAVMNSLLADALAVGTAKIQFPAGIIVVNPIVLPVYDFTGTQRMKSIELCGISQPGNMFGTVGTAPLADSGTIIKTYATSGVGIFSVPTAPTSIFSWYGVTFRNLILSAPDNPKLSGIQAAKALHLFVYNCDINTSRYSVQASQPTLDTACGIVTPELNNGAQTIIRDTCISGFYNGILVNEHTFGDQINLTCVREGLRFNAGYHASYFTRVCAQRNTCNVSVYGACTFEIAQLNIEHAAAGQTTAGVNDWQLTTVDISDPSNLAVAKIRFGIVLGNSPGQRPATDLIKTGGANINTAKVGS